VKNYIDINKNGAAWNLSRAILKHFPPVTERSTITILCIGSDRSTGDSLGPLVGYRLSKINTFGACVIGTLEHPVHAGNLADILKIIEKEIPNRYVIAIDACLGIPGHIGQISVGSGPLKPGAGLKKDLPAVGNMHITGIVNYCGWMEFMVLQNTRLGLVMKMAETIADGLNHALWKYNRYKTEPQNRYIQ
jgi:putative sporulation protein YyaC